MIAEEDLSSWEELTDRSERVYLAHRGTSQSKWLWQKWDLDGEVFSENILTKERRWPKDMDLALKAASGVATPEELAMFRSSIKPTTPHQSSNLQVHQPQQHTPYSNGRLGLQPSFQRPNYSAHGGNQHYHHQNGAFQPSHTAVPASNGTFNGHNRFAHHQSSSAAPQSSTGGAHFPNSVGTQATMHFSQPISRHPHTTSGIHNTIPSHAPWNQTPIAPQEPVDDSLLVQPISQPKRDSAVNASAVDARWNVNVNNGTQRDYSMHPLSYNRDGFRSKPLSAKRNAATTYGDQPMPHQFIGDRYWHTDKPQQKKRSKFADNRSYNISCAEGGQSGPKDGAKTDECASDFLIFRAKPKPVTVNPSRVSSGTFKPSGIPARALLAIATSRVNSELIALMHERDFSIKNKKKGPNTVSSNGLDEVNIGEPVIGLSEKVEKTYLRLTSAPKPEDVRPPSILRRALDNVKMRWKLQERDYDWVCRQMKSIRQDFKVQHVESADSLEVYETHARLALENGDLGEFNTCVAQAQDLHGKLDCLEEKKDEFTAYRILYNLLVNAGQYEQSRLLSKFTPTERQRTATRFALEVRRFFLASNYHRFFILCADPPGETMMAFLLNRLIPTMRSKALSICVVAYAQGKTPILPLTFLLSELGYKESIRDLEEQVSSPGSMEDTNAKYNDKLRNLGILNQPRWILKAVKFLLEINAVIEPAGPPPCNSIEKLVLDCKATRMKGVRAVDHQTGLITHAGGK